MGSPSLAIEVFSDYQFTTEDPERINADRMLSDVVTFCLSGLSKVAGLPQMKLGWIVVSGPEPLRNEAFARLELIADTYLSVGTPVQCAAAAFLDMRVTIQEQIQRRTAANLVRLRESVRSTPFGLLDVEGGWYAILQVPRIRTEEEWALELLRREDVLVQPGFFYDFDREGFLVLSLLTPQETFSAGIARVLALA